MLGIKKPVETTKNPQPILKFGRFTLMENKDSLLPVVSARKSCKIAFANFMAHPNANTARVLRQSCETLINLVSDEGIRK
jgi:hypothetical protein